MGPLSKSLRVFGVSVSLLWWMACQDPPTQPARVTPPPSPAPPPAPPPSPTVDPVAFVGTEDGTYVMIPGGRYTSIRPAAINNSGAVAGTMVDTYTGDRAFAWSPGGAIKDLGTLGGEFAAATAINDRGEVAGFSTTMKGETHAFVWNEANGMRDLGVPAECTASRAYAINNLGVVVGDCNYADHRLAVVGPVRWRPPQSPEVLPLLDDTGGSAKGINDSGNIVGFTTPSNMYEEMRAVSWSDNAKLSVLDKCLIMEECFSEASHINSVGDIVGLVGDAAVLWYHKGQTISIPPLDSETIPIPAAVNDNLQVVGVTNRRVVAAGTPRAFIWSLEEGIRALKVPSGFSSIIVTAINNKGQFAGYAQ